jgi:predicted TIM-barrel fold metal-dependent hydrolase
MIVDCHTHIDFSAEESSISKHLAASETVDRCIVLAGECDSSEQVNKKLSEYVGKHKEKFVGFAFVNPIEDNITVKKLGALSGKLNLSGIVLYCSKCGFHPAHSRAMRLYESAQELELPIFFHNSGILGADAVLDYAQPALLDEVARTFKQLKIVIGALGGPFFEQTMYLAEKHQNVYADLTIRPNNLWGVYNKVMAAHERGVMHKLLFGSGFPTNTAGECIETLLGFNKILGDSYLPTVPRDDIRNVIERNTLQLLGIEE